MWIFINGQFLSGSCFLFLRLCISRYYTNVHNFNFSTGGTMHYGDCNPHGIDTILNRRTAAAAAALNSLTSNTNSSSSPPPPSNLTQTGSSVVGSNTTSNNSAAPGSVNPYFKLEDLHQAAAPRPRQAGVDARAGADIVPRGHRSPGGQRDRLHKRR